LRLRFIEVSMASKRLSKTAVDWSKFAKAVPKEDLGKFQAFKHKSDNYVARVIGLPESLPDLDFAQYKSRAGAVVAVVEQFEKQYKALSVVYPQDKKNGLAAIDQEKVANEAVLKGWLKESSARLAAYEAGVARWNNMPSLDHITKEEWNTYFPEKAKFQPGFTPTMVPHTPEYNDPVMLEKTADYKVPIGNGDH